MLQNYAGPAQSPEQLALDFGQEQLEEPKELASQTITYQRHKKQHLGRTALPDHITTEDIIIEIELIGEEVTETFGYKPGILFKRRYIRRKYVRKTPSEDQSAVLIGELPELPIPKGIPEYGLLAHLFVARYIDHLPFYRQIKMFG